MYKTHIIINIFLTIDNDIHICKIEKYFFTFIIQDLKLIHLYMKFLFNM